LLPAQDRGDVKPDRPEKYTLDYPRAASFCPPVRTTFFEVSHTMGVYKGRRFRQKTNGGYGLPVIDKIGDQHLLHVGADLAWFRVGEPVFAVANGVVRLSTGPDPSVRKQRDQKKPNRLWLAWGNLVVIEHRLADERYVTTIYGHLDTKRLVQTGDIVKAGQQIGTIGKKTPRINGGYNPHLHFGVRKGHKVSPGMKLAEIVVNGERRPVAIVDLSEDEVQIDLPAAIPDGFALRVSNATIKLTKRGDKSYLPSRFLWSLSTPEFQIIGYDLKTDDFLDPVAFLRQQRADSNPAPLRLAE
jgi:murein DD-endopeptidase MepM/ murein hydrolase activator NlpD